MVPIRLTEWPPELKKEKKKPLHAIYSPPRPMARFQNNFTEMFLSCRFTKIAKMVLLRKNTMAARAKNRKTILNKIFF